MRKVSRAAGAAIIGSTLLLAAGAAAQAADVRVLAIGALPGALAQLGPQFEQASGHKLIIEYGATPGLIKKIEAGEPFDVAILVADVMNDPSRQGLFAAGTRPAVSSVGLGAAVRAGAPKPDIGSVEAFKQALLKAKSVSLIPDSVNGKHFISVFERLGIGEEMKAKIKPQKDPAQVAAAVARGEADLALFISNALVSAPGVDYVGPVPAQFQQTLVFTAAVGAKAKEPEAASAFIKHITSPAAAAVMKANGMDVPQP
jgi:molybdate transport system substrate-binding protein